MKCLFTNSNIVLEADLYETCNLATFRFLLEPFVSFSLRLVLVKNLVILFDAQMLVEGQLLRQDAYKFAAAGLLTFVL